MATLVGRGTSFLRQGMKFVHRSEDKDIELEDDWPLYCTREDAPGDPGTYDGLYKHYFTLRHDVRMFRLGNGRVDLEEFIDLVKSSVRENESLKPAADHIFELLKGVDRNFDTDEVPDSSTDVLASQGHQFDLSNWPKESLVFSFASEADFHFSRAVVPFLLYNNYSGWTRDTREDHFLTEYLFITPLSDLEPTKVTVTDRDGRNERPAELASLRLKERYEKYTRSKDDERRAERPRLPDLPKPKVSVVNDYEKREREQAYRKEKKRQDDMRNLEFRRGEETRFRTVLKDQIEQVVKFLVQVDGNIEKGITLGSKGDTQTLEGLKDIIEALQQLPYDPESPKPFLKMDLYQVKAEEIFKHYVKNASKPPPSAWLKKGSGLPQHMSRGHNFHSFLNHRRR